MSTELATYTLAHDAGIDVSKYLSTEETAEVRALVRDLKASGGTAPASRQDGGSTRARTSSSGRTPALVTIAGMKVEALPGMTAKHAAEAKQMAEKVYPMMYLFENSLRDVIERLLRAEHGSDWWVEAAPPKAQKKYVDRKAQEKTEPWHGRRGARPIDYVDLSDLWLIIKDNWRLFKEVFPPGAAWVESLITVEMNPSRRPLAHMNPLATDDIENLTSSFRKWAKLLKAVEGKLP